MGGGGGGEEGPPPSCPKMYLSLVLLVLFFCTCLFSFIFYFCVFLFCFVCASSILDYNNEQGKSRCGSILPFLVDPRGAQGTDLIFKVTTVVNYSLKCFVSVGNKRDNLDSQVQEETPKLPFKC